MALLLQAFTVASIHSLWRSLHQPLPLAGVAACLALVAIATLVLTDRRQKRKQKVADPELPVELVAPLPPAPEPEAEPEPEIAPDTLPLLPAAEVEAAPVSPDDSLVEELAALQAERDDLRAQLAAQERERQQLASDDGVRRRELESALTNAFLSAERAGAELRIQAHQEAERILADAQQRADELTAAVASRRAGALDDLRTMRGALQAALTSLDEAVDPEPSAGSPHPRPPDDLFGVERLRARDEEW
jgi:type IV secretory pathway VirB10-like protein